MPTPSEFWQDTIITDYIDPATGDSYTPLMVPTPESAASTALFPLGLANLQAAMAAAAGEPAVPRSRVIRRAPRSPSTRKSTSCRRGPRRLR